MQYYQINNSRLHGSIFLPASKSQSIRAILFATLADGRSNITNYLASPDINAMFVACRQLGAEFVFNSAGVEVIGTGGKISTPDNIINAGNSGQVLRFVACLAGLQQNHLVITGDHSIRYNRPVKPLITGLGKLGMQCVALGGDSHPPLILKGPFIKDETVLNGEDSQPVSGLLMTLPFYHKNTVIDVINPGETPWIDLTLSWLDKFNLSYKRDGYHHYELIGNNQINGFTYTVPGDLSSLAYPLVAAVITSSALEINNVDLAEPQGDKELITILQQMGAKIDYDELNKRLIVHQTSALQGREVNVNSCIDCITILAVVGCYAQGTTVVHGGEIARSKESDRISIMTQELKKMGANITETADGFIIKQSKLTGAQVQSHSDHRVAMSLAVAGMGCSGATKISDVACVAKSYPNFARDMASIGVAINKEPILC